MTQRLGLLLFCIVLGLLTGCQTITEVEFYPPTPETVEYSTKSDGNAPGRGPIKSIKGKSGSPDFSDNKTFSLTVFNL